MRRMLAAAVAGVLSVAALGAEPPKIAHDWPSYMGPNYDAADRSGVKLIDDITQAKLLWESEEKNIGFGKTTTGYPAVTAEFGNLMPAGAGSPIVAGGAVIMGYFSPSGDAADAAMEAKIDKAVRQRALISADDMLIAIDAATGKTRWKQVWEGKGVNWSSGKRPRYSMTPAAADGRVFFLGTTGRVYAVYLASGKLLWESNVGAGHERVEKAKDEAIKAKHIILNAGDVYGWLVVSGSTLIAPDLGDGLVAFDVKDGKKLWEKRGLVSGYNMPAPVKVDGKPCLLTVNAKGDLRLVALATGETMWTVGLKSLHLTPLVASEKHVFVYEPNPKAADDPKKQNSVGVLAAYRYDAKGATRDWVLPAENAHELHKDHGPTRCVILKDGLVYYSCFPGSAMVIREDDGKILAAAKDLGKSSIFLWGDKVVMNSDLYHRPRRANAEVWQMYDPATLTPLGKGWHVNGSPAVHVATGGYELPTFDAFADGLLFCRVAGGIRCYDLRK